MTRDDTPSIALPQRQHAGPARFLAEAAHLARTQRHTQPENSTRQLAEGDCGVGVRSLYIHTPFCVHKCHYCDFYSIVDTRDRQAAYTERLIRELAAQAPLAGPIETIFVGGGTPTLLAVECWQRILDALRSLYDLSPIDAGRGEVTVECNPETASAELFDVLRAGGVSRLSVGAQSFNTRHLKILERWHDPESVPRALELARAAGIERRSLDLIFAVPGQTLDEWADDLDRALALPIDHLSCYALTYEPGTAMTVRWQRGEFASADEDIETQMAEHTVGRLRTAGFERYEVSNFARMDTASGGACAHNLAYWRQESWLAAGPSASGHVRVAEGGSHRWKNVPRLDSYLAGDDEGFAHVIDHEPPDARRLLAERLMTGVRIAEGFDAASIEAAAEQLGVADALVRAIHVAADRGWLARCGDHWAPTDAGFLVADRLAVNLMEAVDDPEEAGV